MDIEIPCVYCQKTIVRSGTAGKEPTPFSNGGLIKCPYENCRQSWAQTGCPECRKTILRKGPNASSFNNGHVTTCPHQTCKVKFAQTKCPGCDRIVVRSGGDNITAFSNGGISKCPYEDCKMDFAETDCPGCGKGLVRSGSNITCFKDGNKTRCPHENCKVKFAKTDCPSCKKIVVRSGDTISSFNTGSKTTCPYEDCRTSWAQVQCGTCSSTMFRNTWPATFAHDSKTTCSNCRHEFRPSAAPPCDGTLTFEKSSFSEGNFRQAYKARVSKGSISGFAEGSQLVLKCMKPEHFNKGWKISYKDAAMQEEVVRLAKAFNAEVQPTKGDGSCNIHVRAARIYTMTEDKLNSKGSPYLRKGEIIALEQLINGEWEKFNSNSGWSSGAGLPDAFSHWTWAHTKGEMLVCDLQGHRGRPGGPKFGSEEYYYLLTDPAVLSNDGRFGPTDLGEDGMKQWFAGHKCNSMCESIGLVGNRPGRFRFGAKHVRRSSYDWEFDWA